MCYVPIVVLTTCWTAWPHMICPVPCIICQSNYMFGLCSTSKFPCAVCWSGRDGGARSELKWRHKEILLGQGQLCLSFGGTVELRCWGQKLSTVMKICVIFITAESFWPPTSEFYCTFKKVTPPLPPEKDPFFSLGPPKEKKGRKVSLVQCNIFWRRGISLLFFPFFSFLSGNQMDSKRSRKRKEKRQEQTLFLELGDCQLSLLNW